MTATAKKNPPKGTLKYAGSWTTVYPEPVEGLEPGL